MRKLHSLRTLSLRFSTRRSFRMQLMTLFTAFPTSSQLKICLFTINSGQWDTIYFGLFQASVFRCHGQRDSHLWAFDSQFASLSTALSSWKKDFSRAKETLLSVPPTMTSLEDFEEARWSLRLMSDCSHTCGSARKFLIILESGEEWDFSACISSRIMNCQAIALLNHVTSIMTPARTNCTSSRRKPAASFHPYYLASCYRLCLDSACGSAEKIWHPRGCEATQ